MKNIHVDPAICIGCQMCTQIAAHSFKMNDNNISEPIDPPGDNEETVQSAIDSCPVSCISWVK